MMTCLEELILINKIIRINNYNQFKKNMFTKCEHKKNSGKQNLLTPNLLTL